MEERPLAMIKHTHIAYIKARFSPCHLQFEEYWVIGLGRISAQDLGGLLPVMMYPPGKDPFLCLHEKIQNFLGKPYIFLFYIVSRLLALPTPAMVQHCKQTKI